MDISMYMWMSEFMSVCCFIYTYVIWLMCKYMYMSIYVNSQMKDVCKRLKV